MTIGERAAKAIRDHAKAKGIPIYVECENIGTNRKVYNGWNRNGLNPNAYFLQQMALAGYDIMWILTGETYGCEV